MDQQQLELMWQYQQEDMKADRIANDIRRSPTRQKLEKSRDFIMEQQKLYKQIEEQVAVMADRKDAIRDAIARCEEQLNALAAKFQAAPPEDADAARARQAARRGFSTEEEGLAALEKIRHTPFTVTKVERKQGTEAPPRLFDLTSLQVECNKKFGYTADQTLTLVQSLYEKKVQTYPRVDTTYLSDDIYGKCKQILNGIAGRYGELLMPLRGAPLRKSKKVFDSSKVTDHHAIIPTGVAPQHLTDMEQRVFDLVARRFIAVFYPDCRFATTTVLGEAAEIPFKATGRQILEPGWRACFFCTGSRFA